MFTAKIENYGDILLYFCEIGNMKKYLILVYTRIKISVITNISVLYEYIGKISMDILTKISVKRKLTKIL